MTVPAKPLSSVVPGVADSVARVIDVALAFDKAKRWPSARAMQDAVRDAYRERTGRPISVAPRAEIPQTAASRDLAVSRDMLAATLTTLPAAKTSVWGKANRARGPTALLTAGLAVVAIGVALVRPGSSSSSPGVPDAAQAPPAVMAPPMAPPAGTGLVDKESQSPPETPPQAKSPSVPATPGGAAKAPYVRKAASKDCGTPFEIDPITHIKHWKLECL